LEPADLGQRRSGGEQDRQLRHLFGQLLAAGFALGFEINIPGIAAGVYDIEVWEGEGCPPGP
jgi:hypothetical protein